jgi:putative transferase (TIGR04331 family)
MNSYQKVYGEEDTYKIAIELEGVYEEALKVVSYTLNHIHNLNQDVEYWRIIIGPWLIHYIHFLYDKKLLINNCNNSFSQSKLYTDQYIIPYDTLSFFKLLETDSYNIQGINIHQKKNNNDFSVFRDKSMVSNGDKKKLKKSIKYLLKIFNNVTKKKYGSTFDTFISKKEEAKLFLKSKMKIQPIYFDYTTIVEKEIDIHIREILKKVIFEKSNLLKRPIEESKISLWNSIIHNIYLDIPIFFLENFIEIRNIINNQRDDPKFIFTSVGSHYNDLAKVWMAEKKFTNNTKLIGMQHGGVYGSSFYTWYENHELKINDIYLTWGWKRKGDSNCNDAEIVKMFPQKLIGVKNVTNLVEDKVLFLTTNQPRFLFRYPLTPLQHKNYLYKLKKFLSAYPKDKIDQLSIRLYPRDYGWNLDELLAPELNKVKLDKENNFYDSLMKSKLFICDHPSTTFLEALALNKPTLLFWNQEDNQLRTEVLDLYNKLAKVGILHTDVDSVIKQLEEVYSDLDGWWFSTSVQSVVAEFCEQLCAREENELEVFKNFFERELNIM